MIDLKAISKALQALLLPADDASLVETLKSLGDADRALDRGAAPPAPAGCREHPASD